MTPRLALVTLLALTATPAAAQAPTVPLHGGPILPGPEVAFMLGINDDDDATALRGTSYSGSFAYGFGRLGLSGTAGVLAPKDGDSRVTMGALATFRVYGGGVETPLTLGLFGGLGWMAESELRDDTIRHLPIGATAALTMATPYVSIRPWLSPRLDMAWYDPPSTQDGGSYGGNGQENRVGLSGGIDLRFVGGFSIRALADYVDGSSPYVGVAAAYHF